MSFQEIVKKRSRDLNLNMAVSDIPGEMDFVCDAAMSGIKDKSYLFESSFDATCPVVKVQVRRLSDLLREFVPHGTKIDFMSIDCEGHDLRILQSNDWEFFRPHLLLVEEHGDDFNSPIISLAKSQGYRLQQKVGLTLFFEDTH